MHYVKQFDINGVATKQVACIELHGKPNAATEGCVGVLGIDMDSPSHDVYKCSAVNGSIYTWELLSSGMSIMSASISGSGADFVEFSYADIRIPTTYVVKVGDLILDKDGYLYQISTLNSTYCVASYCTRVVAYGMSAYDLAVKNGYEGSEEEWMLSLQGKGLSVKANKSSCTELGDGYIDTNGDLQILTTLPSTFTNCGQIRGPAGESVTVSYYYNYYAVSDSPSPTPSSWSSSIPTNLADGQYLWTRTHIKFSDGSNAYIYTYSKQGGKGDPGTNGTSVTVKSVSESTADGGENVVTFSDGKTLTVKNGNKGTDGQRGTKIAYSEVNIDPEDMSVIFSYSDLPGASLEVNDFIICQEGLYQVIAVLPEEGYYANFIVSMRGENGKSVTIIDTYESTEDGGSNVIYFSDGTAFVVKNGNKGADGNGSENTFEDITLIENAYDETTAEFNYRLYGSGSATALNGCVLLDYTPVKYDPDVFVLIDGIESLGVRWDTRFTVNYYDADKNALPLGQKAPSEFSSYLKNDFDGTLPCSFQLFKPANTTEGIENTEYVRIRVAITSDDTAIDASDCEGLVVKFIKSGSFSANAKGAPLHWKTAVAEKTEIVNSLQESGGKDCVSFAWASDTHMPDNDCGRTNYIGRVMGQMLDNCEIPFAVISGDAGTRGSLATEAEYLECYEKMKEHLSPLWGTDRLLVALGNHEGCWGSYESSSSDYYAHQFTPEKMWQMFFRGQALDFRRVFSDDGLYYYVDNIAQKTRYIVLNSQFGGEYSEDAKGHAVNNRFRTSCYGQAQLDWLADVALDMPSGYGAIIFTHVPPRPVNGGTTPYTVDYAQFNGIINAYCKKTTYSGSFSGVAGWTSNSVSVDFNNAQGEIIALFAGHVHEDTIDTETLECPIITVAAGGASANEGNPNYNRPFGTSLETSFDVVTINRASKMIYCTRLGAGSDRAVSYAKTAPATYIVTWVVDGKTTTETYTEGATPSFKGSTAKASDGQYNYTFTGWSPTIAPVTGNVTYTAQYSKTAIVPDVKTYTITNTLTNCSNSNSATTITEGSAYNATITANDGYTLDSVAVTMGGVDITHTFDDLGTINIGTVTGNIVITAVASETPTEPSYTNLAEPNDTNTTWSGDWVNNARMGSDGSHRPSTNSMVTNLIEINEYDTFYFSGTGFTSAGNGVTSGWNIGLFHTVNGTITKLSGGLPTDLSTVTFTYYDDGTLKTMTFTKQPSDNIPVYMRLCLSNAIDKYKVIISKEPIE